jgi:hypothetical protein
VFQQV